MDCSELERLLPAYADGEFVEGDRTLVEDHLAGCDRCRSEVASQLEFKAFLREKCGSPLAPAPDTLRARIRRDVAAEATGQQARKFVATLGVAAGLVAVASGGYVLAGIPGDGVGSEVVVAEAIDKHARALPVEVTPASGDVGGWFQGKVPFRVQVPRFRSEGAPRLVGARLANVREREAAYLVYGSEPSRRMTLLVFHGDGVELPGGRHREVNGREVVLANGRGYNVALWSERGVIYSLVSDLDEEDVLELVSDVEAR